MSLPSIRHPQRSRQNETINLRILAGRDLQLGSWLVVGVLLVVTPAQAGVKKLPPFSRIEADVRAMLVSGPDYQPNDLISRSDVDVVFQYLGKTGWKVREASAIRGKVLADSSFLIQMFQRDPGRTFIRRSAANDGGYIRLDNLSRLDHGKKILNDMKDAKDGDKLIEYLATTKGGANMGNMLAHARDGRNLNQSDGAIYTADDLVRALRTSYLREEKRREKLKAQQKKSTGVPAGSPRP